jgi:hypothetical protein
VEENAHAPAIEMIDGLLNVLITGANLGFYSDFAKLVELDIQCQNCEEIVRAGLTLPPPYPKVGEASEELWKMTTAIDSSSLSQYVDAVDKIRAAGSGAAFNQIATQFRGGVVAPDVYVKFFGLWRSFNALYNHIIRANLNDNDKIQRFARAAFDKSQADAIVDFYNKLGYTSWGQMQWCLLKVGRKNVFEMLAKADLRSQKKKVNYSQSLQRALRSEDSFAILQAALLCLYSVRNSVIHGWRYKYEEADFLYLCCLLLQEVVVNALSIKFIRQIV